MRTITQRELRNQSAAIMDAVERGESLRITRNGVEVAELRPAPDTALVPMARVLPRFKGLPALELAQLRADEDDLFGPDEFFEPDDDAS